MENMTDIPVVGFAIVGAVVAIIMPLQIFATKSDVQSLRAEINAAFVSKTEWQMVMKKIDDLTLLILSLKKEEH